MTDTPVLDLTAVLDRAKVKLPDGEEIELRDQQEFSVVEWHQIMKLDGDAAELKKTMAESEEDAAKLSQLQRDLVAMLVVSPVLDGELPDWVCAQILMFWAGRLGTPDAAPSRKSRRTTAASSRGSKPSTAAAPKRGSSSRGGR